MHVIVKEEVSQALGEILSGRREPLLKVLNRLYDQLQNHYEHYRNRRYPEDLDFFDYRLVLADEVGNWHTFNFAVNDRKADGFLFVEVVHHRLGEFRF